MERIKELWREKRGGDIELYDYQVICDIHCHIKYKSMQMRLLIFQSLSLSTAYLPSLDIHTNFASFRVGLKYAFANEYYCSGNSNGVHRQRREM